MRAGAFRRAAGIAAFAAACAPAASSFAEKAGGTLRMYSPDSPASMSVHEEATAFAQVPMMGVFNNLVMFDQHQKQSRLDTIVPDLATSWSWDAAGTALTFTLRPGVRWHDGQPFSAKDVVCTFDLLLETGGAKLRINPRKSNFKNLDRVAAAGDDRVTFHLKRPQPAFPMLLATGFAPIYPCHVAAAQMRQHPIGTGPFKFGEFKPNEAIKVARNPDYWKPGRPYLDAIEYTIIKNPATAVLSFVSGQVDMTFPNVLTVQLTKDVRKQAPQVECDVAPGGGANRHLLVNRTAPPFDNPELRRALALTIDRKAFIDILSDGEGQIGGVLQPPPEGLWGMPAELLKELPGYSPEIGKSRNEARRIMERLGYGPNNRLKIRLSTRDAAFYRDPGVILIDQLKEAYIDGALELVELSRYFPKIMRKDYTISLNLQTSGPDPDPILDLFYGCGSSLNWDGYCSAEVDRLIERQSREGDPARRKEMLWTIEKILAEDAARPIIFYTRAGTCRQPYVRGLTVMVDSLFNGNRFEDVWLDR